MFYYHSFHFKYTEELFSKYKFSFFLYQKKSNDKKEEIVNIFIAHVAPQSNEIYHPALLQERKLNIYAAKYKRNIDANLYKPSEKKLHRVDIGDYWPTSIKETIKWFPFLNIMEHTENIMEKYGLMSSLLKVFDVFEIRLSYKKGILDVVYLKCINCKRESGIY